VWMPNSGGNVVFDRSGTVPGGSNPDIAGAGTATVGVSGGSGYYVYFYANGGMVTLNSLDLNVSSAPEPTTLFLAVPGLGLLLLKRRKSEPRS